TDPDSAMEKFALRAHHPSKIHGIERFFVEFNGVRRARADQVWRHRMHSIWNRFYLGFTHLNFSSLLGLRTFSNADVRLRATTFVSRLSARADAPLAPAARA